MKKLLLVLLLFSLLFSGLKTHANEINLAQQNKQSAFKFWFSGGYNGGNFEVNYPFDPDNVLNNSIFKGALFYPENFLDNYGNGFNVGLAIDYDKIFRGGITFGLSTRLYYTYMTASSSVPYAIFPVFIKNNNTDTMVVCNNTFSLNLNYQVISFDILFKVKINNLNLSVLIGPSLSLTLYEHYTSKVSVDVPNNYAYTYLSKLDSLGYKYTDNNRTIIIRDGNIKNFNTIILGWMEGIQWETSLMNMNIKPGLFLDIKPASLSKTYNMKLNNLLIALDILY